MGTCSCRLSVLRYRSDAKMVQRLTVAGSPTTPPVINGALFVLQEVNLPTSTKRSQGRFLSVVFARPLSEVSVQLVLMKGNACLSEKRKSTVRMVVTCATSVCGKRLSEPF